MYSPYEIGQRLLTQDNQCTADPIYLVEVCRRYYGYETSWNGDTNVWLYKDEADEVPPEIAKQLADGLLNEEDYIYTGYEDRWEFVQVFFTAEAAQEYIKNNAHRYNGKLRMFVDSGYRNKEWQTIRKMLMEEAKD